MIWLLGRAISGGVGMPKLEQRLLSPDTKYESLKIISTGGGAAGWCREFVVIRKSATDTNVQSYPESKDELVFSTPCNSSGYKMNWASANELVITFVLSKYELQQVEMRSANGEGNISVRFEPKS